MRKNKIKYWQGFEKNVCFIWKLNVKLTFKKFFLNFFPTHTFLSHRTITFHLRRGAKRNSLQNQELSFHLVLIWSYTSEIRSPNLIFATSIIFLKNIWLKQLMYKVFGKIILLLLLCRYTFCGWSRWNIFWTLLGWCRSSYIYWYL